MPEYIAKARETRTVEIYDVDPEEEFAHAVLTAHKGNFRITLELPLTRDPYYQTDPELSAAIEFEQAKLLRWATERPSPTA